MNWLSLKKLALIAADERAPNSAGLAQFRRMAPYALPKRARTRVARAIEPGAWRARRPAPGTPQIERCLPSWRQRASRESISIEQATKSQSNTGSMNASGAIDVSPAAELSGRISVVLGTQTTTFARGTLNVGGSLKDPLLSP